jgi:hypothetical protein
VSDDALPRAPLGQHRIQSALPGTQAV